MVSALYSAGTLLVSEAAGSDGRTTQLLVACRNACLPASATNISAASNQPGLRELVSELDNFVPGVRGEGGNAVGECLCEGWGGGARLCLFGVCTCVGASGGGQVGGRGVCSRCVM